MVSPFVHCNCTFHIIILYDLNLITHNPKHFKYTCPSVVSFPSHHVNEFVKLYFCFCQVISLSLIVIPFNAFLF